MVGPVSEVTGSSSLRRRRLLSAVTLTVLMCLLLVSGYVGYRTLFASAQDASADTQQGCQAAIRKGDVLRARDIKVSVYNAGTRSGLADKILTSLQSRGFLAGEAGNAPDRARVRFVRVLATRTDDPAARLVALQFGRRTPLLKSKDDLGPGVDVMVGDGFEEMTKRPPNRLKATASGSGC